MSDDLYDGPCEAGCQHFHGGEVRHHKDCGHYPESLTKMTNDRIEELEADKAKLLKALKRAATVIFNYGNRYMTQGISTAEVDLIDATISKIKRQDQ